MDDQRGVKPGFDVDSHVQRMNAVGYSVIEDFLPPERIAAVRQGLAPFLKTHEGRNNFEGFNVLAIVLQFPPDLVAEGSDQIGVFGLTVRRNPGEYPSDDRRLDRMGNPAVQTAFISTALDDEFNRSLPVNDERNFGDVIVSSLQEFGTSEENIDILASVAVPDTLKLDLTRPVEYPNGRALDDDVIDILLSLVLNGPMGDGADSNDRSFLDTFPYLAPPFQAP